MGAMVVDGNNLIVLSGELILMYSSVTDTCRGIFNIFIQIAHKFQVISLPLIFNLPYIQHHCCFIVFSLYTCCLTHLAMIPSASKSTWPIPLLFNKLWSLNMLPKVPLAFQLSNLIQNFWFVNCVHQCILNLGRLLSFLNRIT